MRHLRLRLFSVSLILFLLFFISAFGQPSGGYIGFFNSIEINESLYNFGFTRLTYSGSGDNFRSNYTGSGGLLFNWQIDGSSVFLATDTGSINHLGPFTTYMLGLKDSDRTHALVHKWNENDSADRVLNWLVTGANRSITLEGDSVLDQDLSSDSTPAFNGLTIGSGGLAVTGIADGGLTSYDLKVGDTTTPDYGMVQIGNFVTGRTSFKGGNVDCDGTVIFRNLGGPVSGLIEFLWSESAGNTTRFAIPKSGVGNATYNPRSMLIAGPAPVNTNMVTVGYWQSVNGIFDNLLCDTSGFGADLGVQNDLEVEGDIYADSIKESSSGAGVTFSDGLIIPSGTTPAPDIVGAIFLDTNESANGSLMLYSNGSWRKVIDL